MNNLVNKSGDLVNDLVNDCISRAAVLNLIEQSCCDLEYKCDNVALRKEVEALPPAQPGWIPTSERLPDVRQLVLCQCRAGIMDVLRLTADGSWSKNYPHAEYMSGFVVAWMPLPKPWEGDANG